MRLQELFETTSDDREISKISTQIYSYISSNFGTDPEATGSLGTVGEICRLPDDNPLSNISIDFKSNDELKQKDIATAKKNGQNIDPYAIRTTVGTWNADHNQIQLNSDFIGSNKLKTVIAHELRHALDDKKSDNWASASTRYATPKKKEHRVAKDEDDKTPYLAEPAEINARFMELQHQLAGYIPRIYKNFPPNQIKAKIKEYIPRLLDGYRIASLFPEKTQSKDYKRLISRLMSFVEAEMKDAEVVSNKSATGNW